MKQVIILDPDTKRTINQLTQKGEKIIADLTRKGEDIVTDLTQRTEAIMEESLAKFQESVSTLDRLAAAIEKLTVVIDEVDDNLDGNVSATKRTEEVPEGRVTITEEFTGIVPESE